MGNVAVRNTETTGLELPMPTYEALYEFLLSHYRVERFEGRNNTDWSLDYSHIVARSAYEYLREHGHGFIGQHECAFGRAIRYDRSLEYRISPLDLARDRMMQAERVSRVSQDSTTAK